MPLEFYTNVGYRRYFRDTWSATHKYMPGVKLPQACVRVLFLLVEPNLADKIGNSFVPSTRLSDHHLASKDNNSSSSGRHDLVEWVRQNG